MVHGPTRRRLSYGALADAGDVYTEATKEIIRKGGLDPEKDINFRYGGNSNQRMAALVAGAVDAVPLIPPQDRMMTDQGFNSLAYYPDYFPNLTLSLPYAEEAQPTFALRGVTTNDWSQNQSSPIAMYVDEVYKPVGAVQALQTFDLDRVEVLRGPQGTLYGQNSSAGAVKIAPKLDQLGRQIAAGFIHGKALMGVFDEGCMELRTACR